MADKCILIIHDDPDMVTALRLSLESAGYQVKEAGTCQDGLRKVEEINPALIILDVALEMASCVQVSLELRNPAPDSNYTPYRYTPILMLTSPHTTTSMLADPDEACLPVDDFVDKPVDPDVLLEKVCALIGPARFGQ